MQFALFLDADAAAFAEAFCGLLPAAKAAQFGPDGVRTRAAEALAQSNAFVTDTVAASHPTMRRHLAGGGELVPLLQIPAALHAPACRLSALAQQGTIAFELCADSSAWRAAALPVLRHTPELRRLRVPATADDDDSAALCMGAVAPQIARLTQLTAIELRGAPWGCVAALMPHLAALPRLVELALDELESTHSKAVLCAFGRGLAALHGLTALRLDWADVNDRFAACVGSGLAGLRALKVLSLRNAAFTGEAACTLAHHLPELEAIDFGTSGFASAPDCVSPTAERLRRAPTFHDYPGALERMRRHDHRIEAAGATAVLQCVPTLTHAAFVLRDHCNHEVLRALSAGPPLTSLELGSTSRYLSASADPRADVFERFCSGALRALRVLRLWGPVLPDTCMPVLASSLAACTALAELRLSSHFTLSDVLYESLLQLSGLTRLEVSLGRASAQHICKMTQLQHLAVRAAHMVQPEDSWLIEEPDTWHDDTAQEMAGALAGLSRLTYLCLDVGTSDRGTAPLVRAVGTLSLLRSLQLFGVTFHSAVTDAIRDAWDGLTELETLWVRDSIMTGPPLWAIARLVHCWPRLACISLPYLLQDDKGVDAIDCAARSAAMLTTLNLAGTRFSAREEERLASVLRPLRGQLRPVRVAGAAREVARLRAQSGPVAAARGVLDLTDVGIFRY